MKIVEEHNWKLYNILQQLKDKEFFRIFKVDLDAECHYFDIGRLESCTNPKCSVQQCSLNEVPNKILELEEKVAHCNAAKKVDKTLDTHDIWDDDLWFHVDKEKLKYVDYGKNPVGWTGYTGNTANSIWLEIHNICLNSHKGQCSERDILRRLVSGMHSNTNMHIVSQYPLEYNSFTGDVSKYGYNYDLFMTFFPNIEWIENLYFTYIFLLKAVGKLKTTIKSDKSEYDKDASCQVCADDMETRVLIDSLYNNELMKNCNEEFMFDDHILDNKQGELLHELKDTFKQISSIINCTECEKCRLHAKQEIVGIGTSLKLMFENENAEEPITISRNEIVALINTVAKFSDSIHQYNIIREHLKNEYDYKIRQFNKNTKKSVVIVGSGLAGLSSAYWLNNHMKNKYNIILLDKNNTNGGNSAKATSGINGSNTLIQNKLHINDNEDSFKEDTIKSSGYVDAGSEEGNKNLRNKLDKISNLVKHSGETIEWLKSIGVDLDKVSQLGGHSHPRTHRLNSGPIGWTIVDKIKTQIAKNKEIYNLKGVKVTSLQKSKHNTKKYELEIQSIYINETIYTDVVILATGGFSYNRSMLEKYNPKVANKPTTNGEFATGDGILLGESLGGHSVDMEYVQLHPTGFIDPFDRHNPIKFLGPEALRGSGGIMINELGQRFCNELGYRDYVTQKMEEQNNTILVVLNNESKELFGPNFNFYYNIRKFFTKFNNSEELAQHYKMDPEVIRNTLNNYGSKIDEFGKSTFLVKFDADEALYVAEVEPVIHYTMGGLETDDIGRCLDTNGRVIEDLYAVGEVSAGVHGRNRLAGNSLLECAVFGRLVAQSIIDDNYGRKEDL